MTKLTGYLKENYLLLLILSLASFLRIYRADCQSLWIDEINTMVQANPELSFRETYKTILTLDLQPPLYFYLLKYLFTVFGYTTLVLRLFSAVLGIFGVWAIYLLGKEIYTKKTGLYAAAMLSVNLYHIYYSQEARPYVFLVLFTILSFYRLIRYLKINSYKNALYYGIFSALMLYGHPYGLFSLAAQFIAIVYYFFAQANERKWFFVKTSLLAALTVVILYLPGLELFFNAANVQSFWIELPRPDVYALMLKEFFAESEFLVATLYLLLIYFFLKVFDESNKYSMNDFSHRSLARVFFFLVCWVLVGTLIPFARSYLTVPMIVSRYLIGLIPAIILMAATALTEMERPLVSGTLVVLIFVFSFTHIFVVKKYYTSPTKHDLRGAAEFVLKNKTEHEPIASRIGWHYSSYYLRNIKNPVIMTSFDAYINTIIGDSLKPEPFWYIDGQSIIESVTPEHQAFLDKYFVVTKKINLYGSTANHFQPVGKKIIPLNLKEFNPIVPTEYGFIPFYGNSSSRSKPLVLESGKYRLFIGGRSQPEQPIEGVNAHITVKVNGTEVGSVFLPESHYQNPCSIQFAINETREVTLELTYDNDVWINKQDRNAQIFAVYLEKL